MAENAARNLRLFRELLTCAHNVWFWTFDTRLEAVYYNCPQAQALQTIFRMNEAQIEYLLPLAKQGRPVVLSDALGLTWIADYEPDSEGNLLYIHVIGPVFVADVSPKNLEYSLDQTGISITLKQEFLKIMEGLPIIPITRFFEYGMMFHYCITEEKITISDLQYPETQQPVRKTEAPQRDVHGTWAMEQELLRLVEEGNPDYKKKAARLVTGANLANVGGGDSLRHLKNITIIFTALCIRAAIRGGLAPEIAYTLSDKYIASTEACTNLSDLVETNSAMQEDFVTRVHQCKLSQQSSPIQRCCNYIQLHLGEKMTIPLLAGILGYSENYLTKKFKAEMNMNITEYITVQRVEMAKELLISGEESIQDICLQLGFGSQSYFGLVFRRETGLSPSDYRKQRGMQSAKS